MIQIGDELTVDHDIIGISGQTRLQKDQKVIIRTIECREGFWGKRTGIWHPSMLVAIGIEGMEGSVFFPKVFKEIKDTYEF